MICYVNGDFVTDTEAKVSIFDRGFLFADGVYEVSLVLGGQLVDNRGHLARLARSLQKLGIVVPLTADEIVGVQKALIDKNQLVDGSIYLQVTRGSGGRRDFLLNDDTVQPTVVLVPGLENIRDNAKSLRGISVMSLPEIRWAHRDIKSIGLLGAVMAKQAAQENGFDDAWFVENGLVTEASAANASIIKGKTIITKAPNQQILNGITRQSIARLADEYGYAFVERDFSIAEAQQADEAFVSSATKLIVGVVKIDNSIIADGQPGAMTKRLRELYIESALANRLP